MAEIVNSLFGTSPESYLSERNRRDYLDTLAVARQSSAPGTMMSPSLAPFYQQAAQEGQLIGRGVGAIAGMLGVEDPELVKLRDVSQMRTQFDLTNPEGIRQYSRALAAKGYGEFSTAAAAIADQREKDVLNLQKTRTDIQKTQTDIARSQQTVEREDKLREALAALPPNATEAQYLAVFRQFGSPDQQARVIQASMDRNAKLAAAQAEAGAIGTAGAVGKGGAYRDINGTIYGPAEMKPIRQEFKGAQDLLDTLNQITPQDVKNSESFVDWTTKSNEVKSLATKKTLTAQSKIALSQLMQQIESLPPGSASDADMRAAMKNFPGYSDPDALATWINDTKAKLERSINRTSDQFGFKPTVKSSGRIDLKAKPAAGISTSDNDLITKYLTPTSQQGR